ncbi:MAG: hypothetical protein BWY76_02487 [bacterium ADurb.Bin429]|nr:MAG: hypothetical protein BWY76_02487 [bacterium ADurb.Bin429]
MQRLQGYFILFCLIGILVLFAGCGGGEAPALSPGMGRLAVRVAWPAAASRFIPAAAARIRVAVEGPDITMPFTATIVRPATTTMLAVPAGSDRVVTLTVFDADGVELAVAGQRRGLTIALGQTATLSLTLAGTEDLDDTPTSIALDAAGTGAVEGILETRDAADLEDRFIMDAVEGQSYLVTFESLEVAADDAAQPNAVTLAAHDGATLLASTISARPPSASLFTPVALTVVAPRTGPITLSVAASPGEFAARYRLTIASSGETGAISVIAR